MAITDLTNTTWVVPAGWSATAGYGIFSIVGTLEYDGVWRLGDEYNSYLAIGYEEIYADCEPKVNSIANADRSGSSASYEIRNTTQFKIAVTGGTDATNASLISWLETYGELQAGPTPTDEVTIEYNNAVIASLKAGQSATLPCKDKPMHTDVVVTVPDGMGAGEVVEEWDGSYTVTDAVELITFVLDGDIWEAEQGMTWQQWCESEYNTGGFYISGTQVKTSIGMEVHGVKPTDVIISQEYAISGGGSND